MCSVSVDLGLKGAPHQWAKVNDGRSGRHGGGFARLEAAYGKPGIELGSPTANVRPNGIDGPFHGARRRYACILDSYRTSPTPPSSIGLRPACRDSPHDARFMHQGAPPNGEGPLPFLPLRSARKRPVGFLPGPRSEAHDASVGETEADQPVGIRVHAPKARRKSVV